jgi:peptidoglycan/LPS O-acetylase OafA/YrhL
VKQARTVLGLYVAGTFVDFAVWGLPLGNQIPTYLVPVMGAAVLTLAYCRPGVSDRVLRSNDVSYGLYIYHMPVVNTLSYLGFNSPAAILAALTASSVLAVASWKFVERPFLRRKRQALRSVSRLDRS